MMHICHATLRIHAILFLWGLLSQHPRLTTRTASNERVHILGEICQTYNKTNTHTINELHIIHVVNKNFFVQALYVAVNLLLYDCIQPAGGGRCHTHFGHSMNSHHTYHRFITCLAQRCHTTAPRSHSSRPSFMPCNLFRYQLSPKP